MSKNKLPPPPPREPAEIVELSRYRAALGRGRRLRRADAIFHGPDPRGAVRALPPDEFYYVLHEAGFPDGLDVLMLGTPDQVQAALDFALWDRDQISPVRAEEWLAALVEAPYDTLGRWAKGIDVELLALLLRQRARICDLSLDEEPENSDAPSFRTPDGLFHIEMSGGEDEARLTMKLLDSLYRHDSDWARRILVGTRGELDAELEETAYRWRSGRMADLGFEDHYDALEVYRELDPTSVVVGDAPAERVRPLGDGPRDGSFLQVPSALAERLASGSPFARAVGGIDNPDDLSNLHAALVALSNRVLSADRITPGDEVALGATLTRVSATLDLAVEVLARGSADEATRAVRSVPVMRLFRLGVSIVGKVKALALALKNGSPFAKLRPAIDLFEDEDAAVLDALTQLRPVFPRWLDQPPADGTRPFAALVDVAAATAALERAGAALAFLRGFGVRPEGLAPAAVAAMGVSDPAELDAGLLARTVLAHRLVGEPAALRPLPAEALSRLALALAEARTRAGGDALRARLLPVFVSAWPGGVLSPAASAVAERWVTALVDGAPVLGRRRP